MNDIGEVQRELERMESRMKEINAFLYPMVMRDPARRDEPAWNAWAISGGLGKGIERLRGWVQALIREIT